MASAQGGGGGGGGGSNGDNNDDLGIVYRAVCEGASAEQVRAILSGGPRTRRARSEWLEAVVNYKNPANGEAALKAAHCRRDGAIVGLLLENGADARALGHNANALAICIAYGQVNSLRVLLRSGRHRADERVGYWMGGDVEGASGPILRSRPVHLCVVPPRLSTQFLEPPPHLECLDVLVREFGADVNALDEPYRKPPLCWLDFVPHGDKRRAFDALMALGADLNSRDASGKTFIFHVEDLQMLQQVLARGASPNVIASDGDTPLARACRDHNGPLVSALLPVTSNETRRSVLLGHGNSALDWLLYNFYVPNLEHWKVSAIEELLSSRVPVDRQNACRALPFAARVADRLEAQAAKRNRTGAMQWRAHEDLSGLAMGFQELRHAEARVEERERRVAELEEELRRRGIGTEDDDGDEEAGGATATSK